MSGCCILLSNTPISWSSKKLSIVSRSSTEAKYMSLASTTLDIMWIISLSSELEIPLREHDLLWCDNQSAIALACNHVLHARIKHIELNFSFVCEQVKKKLLVVQYVLTND